MSTLLPQAVINMNASRERRMHHYLWHQVRNMWLFWDETTKQKLRDLGWEPPRPARRPTPTGGRETILDNNSGEDFLYMHRQMISSTNSKLAEIADPNYPRIIGWPNMPLPEDQDYPVPSAWDTGDADFNSFLINVKSDEFFTNTMQVWENDLTSDQNIRNMSLGELGARIEFTIHNMMHMRWCKEFPTFRPDVDPTNPDTIDPQWDNPSYNWLGDTYSSHVHSTFWKLHGWCDDRIDQWMNANGVQGDVLWQGKWVGRMPSHPAPNTLHAALSIPNDSHKEMHHGHDHISDMELAVKAIMQSGEVCHFYDEVEVPNI